MLCLNKQSPSYYVHVYSYIAVYRFRPRMPISLKVLPFSCLNLNFFAYKVICVPCMYTLVLVYVHPHECDQIPVPGWSSHMIDFLNGNYVVINLRY